MDINTLKNKVLAKKFSEIKDVLESFDKHNCKYTLIKGEALSLYAYGTEGQRISSDYDILVSHNQIGLAKNILLDKGYYSKDLSRKDELLLLLNSHQISPWKKQSDVWGDICIDLNFDIFWGEYKGKRIDIEQFISDCQIIEIYGMKVKTLSPIKTIVHLALHHYKDMNSIFILSTRKSIRKEMFKDMYYLIKNNLNENNIDVFYECCRQYEIVPYVFYVLYYTNMVYNDCILIKCLNKFRTKDGEELLENYGLSHNHRKKWKCDFYTRMTHDNLYKLIEDDLTQNDKNIIEINKKIFYD